MDQLFFFRPKTGTFVIPMEASLAWLAGRRGNTMRTLSSHAQFQFATQTVGTTGSASNQTLAPAKLGGETESTQLSDLKRISNSAS